MKSIYISRLNRILLVSLLNSAIFLAGCGGGSSSPTPAAAPPQPKVLISASPRSAISAYTTFTVVNTTATKFNVYRSTTSGSVGQKVGIDLPATSTEFIDKALTSNVRYWYTVEAVTSSSSIFSTQIPVTTPAGVIYPAPPANLIATPVPPASKIALPSWNIEWDAYPGATDYVVYSTTVAELVGNAQLSTEVAVVTTPLLTGQTLTTGGVYYYWVVARSNGWILNGQQMPSNPAMIRIVDNSRTALLLPTVDAPVIDTIASSQQADYYRLYFYGARGAGSYHVYAEAEERSLMPITATIKTFPSLDGAPTNLPISLVRTGYYRIDIPYSTLTALSSGTFSLYVDAVGSVRPITASSKKIAIQVPASASPSTAVSRINPPVITTMSPTRVDLVWDPIQGATSYQVYRGNPVGAPLATTTNTYFSDTSLAPDSRYDFTIVAVTPSNASNVSFGGGATTFRNLAPVLDSSVHVDIGTWQANLTWKGANDGLTYAIYSEYQHSLFPVNFGSNKSRETWSASWDAQTNVSDSIVKQFSLFPIWGCFWVAEVYPDQTASPLSNGVCTSYLNF